MGCCRKLKQWYWNGQSRGSKTMVQKWAVAGIWTSGIETGRAGEVKTMVQKWAVQKVETVVLKWAEQGKLKQWYRNGLLQKVETVVLKWAVMEVWDPKYWGSWTLRLYCSSVSEEPAASISTLLLEVTGSSEHQHMHARLPSGGLKISHGISAQ